MAKKYFWLKIQEDFFRQKEVKALRKKEKGALYIIIYQKMMVYSLKNNNKLYFDNVEDSFEEEIALVIDEEVEDVKATLDFLKKTHLVDCISAEEMEMLQVEELTGEESESSKRVRKHRMNKKKEELENKESLPREDIKNKSDKSFCKDYVRECNAEETFCNKNVTLEKEKELELEKELEPEIKPEIKLDSDKIVLREGEKESDENFRKIIGLYEQNIGPLYPALRQWFLDICDKIDYQLFEKAVEICINNSRVTPSYLKGIIRRCINENIHTLEEYNSKNREFINQKSSQSYKKPLNFSEKLRVSEKIDPNMLKEIELMEAKLGVS